MRRDPSYSPDVEIDETDKVVFARDIAEGERIAVPVHMLGRFHAQSPGAIYRFGANGEEG